MMETIQIQLPPALLRRIRQEATSNETLSQLIAEAVQMWLTKKRKKIGICGTYWKSMPVRLKVPKIGR